MWARMFGTYKQIDKNKFIVDAKIEVEVFIAFFELNLDPLSIDAETLGGLFISKFGVLPKVGESIKIDGLTIEVSDTCLLYTSPRPRD